MQKPLVLEKPAGKLLKPWQYCSVLVHSEVWCICIVCVAGYHLEGDKWELE